MRLHADDLVRPRDELDFLPVEEPLLRSTTFLATYVVTVSVARYSAARRGLSRALRRADGRALRDKVACCILYLRSAVSAVVLYRAVSIQIQRSMLGRCILPSSVTRPERKRETYLSYITRAYGRTMTIGAYRYTQ